MATKTKKPVHSFSTNFFGALGYVGSSAVWLLAIATSVYLFPSTDAIVTVWSTFATETTSESIAPSPVIAFLLYAVLAVAAWGFVYFAARILSRVIRRIGLLFARKVTYDVFFKAKYFVHALGLVVLVIMLLIAPAGLLEKNFIAFMGLISGLAGISAIVIQRRLTDRHMVPVEYLL